jgi:heptosyltransferase-2
MDKSIKKILILRFRRVGDAVISSVICSSLRKTFPEAEIHYVLNENIAPLFLHHPDIDRVIAFGSRELDRLPDYVRKVRSIVRENRYDVIVDTRSTVRTLFFSLFGFSVRYRIGKKKLYNRLLQNCRVDNHFDGTNDAVDMNLRLLSPLESVCPVCYERRFRLYVSDEEREAFRRYMQREGVDFRKPVVVCAVAARLRHKRWKMERMAALLSRMLERYDCLLVFNYGDEEERAFARQLHSEMSDDERVFSRIEARNLRELAAMLANACFFFGNEGGARHVSQALDVPSLAIYPPGIGKREWLPNACERFRGIEAEDVWGGALPEGILFAEAFDLLTVDAVWEQLDPMLQRYLLQRDSSSR